LRVVVTEKRFVKMNIRVRNRIRNASCNHPSLKSHPLCGALTERTPHKINKNMAPMQQNNMVVCVRRETESQHARSTA